MHAGKQGAGHNGKWNRIGVGDEEFGPPWDTYAVVGRPNNLAINEN
jgi:hypothetical protein